jgi:hypothetical protein
MPIVRQGRFVAAYAATSITDIGYLAAKERFVRDADLQPVTAALMGQRPLRRAAPQHWEGTVNDR